jgi:hypothetical protein
MRCSSYAREELANFLKASPAVTYWLERWQADKRADCSPKAA